MNGINSVTIIIAILILLLCFYFVSTTGDKYLAPSLGIMSEKLGLTQNFAGITLLAYANQAPDVIAAVVSSDDEDEGLVASLGALIGAGMIVVGIVFGIVIFFGKVVEVSPHNYIRDLFTYALGIALFMIFGIFKNINVYEVIIMVILYFVYIIHAYIMDKKKQKKLEEIEKTEDIESINEEEYQVKMYDEMNSKNF